MPEKWCERCREFHEVPSREEQDDLIDQAYQKLADVLEQAPLADLVAYASKALEFVTNFENVMPDAEEELRASLLRSSMLGAIGALHVLNLKKEREEASE